MLVCWVTYTTHDTCEALHGNQQEAMKIYIFLSNHGTKKPVIIISDY